MSTLFTIYHPYSSSWFKTTCELGFGIKMYPEYPTSNEHIYSIYMINDMIHTHFSQKISKFIRNQFEYKIYSYTYDEHTGGHYPLLHVSIYEDLINIKLSKLYNFNITNKDKIDYILSELDVAYNNYKRYIADNNRNADQMHYIDYVVETPERDRLLF